MPETAALVPDIQPSAVLNYWFPSETDRSTAGHSTKPWLGLGESRDSEVQHLFGKALEKALAGGLKDWETEGESRVALVILLDQCPRHAWRRSVRSLMGDVRAKALATSGWRRGYFADLDVHKQLMVMVPLLRSESAYDQALASDWLSTLNISTQDVAATNCLKLNELQRFQIEHFERLVTRNELLGRANSEEEAQWLSHQDIDAWVAC